MNNGTYSNKPQPRTYFVSDVLANLPNSAAYVPAGTAFINETNAPVTVNTVVYQPGLPMIANGQIQFYSGDDSTAVDAATDPTTIQSFFIAQGRDESLDTNSLGDRPFEQSELIATDSKLKIRPRLCQIDRNSAWVIGAPNASASGNINPLDNTTYGLTVAYRGHWAYRMNGRNTPAYFPQYEVEGTWVELGIAAVADQRDYIVQGLAYNINRSSRLFGQLETEPVFALALEAAGAGVALNTIVVGQVLTIAYKNGNTALPVQVTVTNGIFQAIQAAIASGQVLGTDTIVIANPSSIPGGTSGNGTFNAAQLLLIALDRIIVDTDRKMQVKYRIEVGANEGFNVTVNSQRVSTNFEGFGLGRHVQLDYEEYAELNKKWRVQAPSGNAFQFPSDVNQNRAYLLVDIEGYRIQEGSTGNDTAQPYLITLAIPCCDSGLRTAWNTFLNGFFGNMPSAYFEGDAPEVVDAKTIDITTATTPAPCDVAFDNPFKTA